MKPELLIKSHSVADPDMPPAPRCTSCPQTTLQKTSAEGIRLEETPVIFIHSRNALPGRLRNLLHCFDFFHCPKGYSDKKRTT